MKMLITINALCNNAFVTQMFLDILGALFYDDCEKYFSITHSFLVTQI
jgi:hypothetical protein